ncbi:hypothetical protein [Paenibacillus polymyxa]|nr:hypothetical protein [Paenibacillus polymyxa]
MSLVILSLWSHSVWGAWIEMTQEFDRQEGISVALCMECVD